MLKQREIERQMHENNMINQMRADKMIDSYSQSQPKPTDKPMDVVYKPPFSETDVGKLKLREQTRKEEETGIKEREAERRGTETDIQKQRASAQQYEAE